MNVVLASEQENITALTHLSVGKTNFLHGPELERGKMKVKSTLLIVAILSPIFIASFTQPVNAFTIGCKSAQSQAKMLSSRAEVGMKLEFEYRSRPIYEDAYRVYKSANETYRDWERIITKSPKCFKKSEVQNVKKVLKPISIFQSMSTRYGATIAERFNYGSPDPCFQFLGNDNAYLACSIDNY